MRTALQRAPKPEQLKNPEDKRFIDLTDKAVRLRLYKYVEELLRDGLFGFGSNALLWSTGRMMFSDAQQLAPMLPELAIPKVERNPQDHKEWIAALKAAQNEASK